MDTARHLQEARETRLVFVGKNDGFRPLFPVVATSKKDAEKYRGDLELIYMADTSYTSSTWCHPWRDFSSILFWSIDSVAQPSPGWTLTSLTQKCRCWLWSWRALWLGDDLPQRDVNVWGIQWWRVMIYRYRNIIRFLGVNEQTFRF